MTTPHGTGDTAPTTSWQARAMVAALRLLQTRRLMWAVASVRSVAAARARRAARGAGRRDEGRPPARLFRELRIVRAEHAGWPVWTLLPPRPRRSDRVVVYLHGGAYLWQVGATHYRWCADVARATGATVVVPVYPLVPTGTAAETVPTAADLIASVVAEHAPDAVTVAGNSAGGGLALAAVQELLRRGAPVPARLVLISPWLDVTVGDPASADIDDPFLGPDGLRACGRLWAGDLDPGDPRVSPLFGPLAGLPPTTVYAGARDVLYPDAVRLRQRAEAEGADVDLVVHKAMVHTWPLLPALPEARQIRPRLHRSLVG
ncbi:MULTISPECIES: alpha/beta hydrolase fold domain-containing protein [unclassified Nocardiopsis]|uniref:alpha/beta hydrolase fold domain-containing protein n=1 Tax=unclassified Nocardiopsis TaxID=2649073 RepID=UPI0013591BAE|nr:MULTISPECIES: alpha/beta hydrolase fold domain-containing protein [unclassified Nocardiopsis]